jgi:hypothetical protein
MQLQLRSEGGGTADIAVPIQAPIQIPMGLRWDCDVTKGRWVLGVAILEFEQIQTRMIQKPLLWVEVGKSACVLMGICELRLSPPA